MFKAVLIIHLIDHIPIAIANTTHMKMVVETKPKPLLILTMKDINKTLEIQQMNKIYVMNYGCLTVLQSISHFIKYM